MSVSVTVTVRVKVPSSCPILSFLFKCDGFLTAAESRTSSTGLILPSKQFICFPTDAVKTVDPNNYKRLKKEKKKPLKKMKKILTVIAN